MENKNYTNEIINYLKDDKPSHANASMRKYMTYLGYTDNEIGKYNYYQSKLIYEKDIIIKGLQQKLDKQEKAIQEILNVKKYSKIIYHIGLWSGITLIFAGFIDNIFIFTISGFGISITSIVGLYEAKINKL